MTLYGFLDILQGFLMGVAPAVTTFQRWTVRMEDVFIGLDYDTKEIRLRSQFLSGMFHTHDLMIPRIGAVEQACDGEQELKEQIQKSKVKRGELL